MDQSQIRLCAKYIYLYIYIYIYNIEHGNLEMRKTRNDFSVHVWNFLLPSSLKVFQHKEREAQSFYSGFFICPCTRYKGLGEQVKVNCLLPRQVSTLLTDFFKIPPNPSRASGAWRHLQSLATVSQLGYCDISEWHVRSAQTPVNTCVNVAPY